MNPLNDLVLQEGWPRIGAWLAGAIVLAVLDCELLSLLALIAAGMLAWTYRKPVRTIVHFEAAALTSPCDGRVSRIQTLKNGETVIEIESGCLDASLLCSPFESDIVDSGVVRGARLRRSSTLRSLLNEYGSVAFQNSEGQSVTVTHTLARDSAPLGLDRFAKAAHLLRGAPYGVMTSGTTQIRLPASARVAVNPGERVRAVETLLGYLG